MKKATKNTIRFYLKHTLRNRFELALILFSIFVGVASEMVIPFLYKMIVDSMSTGTDAAFLFNLIFIILGVNLLHWAGWRTASYATCDFQPRCMSAIMDECFAVIHNHSFNFFSNNFTGGLVKKVNRMARSFEDIMDYIFFNFYTLFLKIAVSTIMLFYLKPFLGIAMIIWIAVFIGINYFFALYKLTRYDLPKAAADTRVTASLSDTFLNSSNVKLFAALPFETGEFKKTTADWFKKTKKAWFASQHIELLQGLLMVLIEFIIMYFAVKFWLAKSISIGDIVLIQSYIFLLFNNLWDFGRTVRNLYERLADAEEMTEILDTPIEVEDKKKAKSITITRGKIEFDSADFSYIEEDVIKKLSLKIKPGEKVALIGPSGGGKSTIVKLILRLFDLDAGKILIDNQDISKITQDSLRSQIALVPQDPILFHRSLMENIRYGRLDASDEEVFAAARLANCHDFISEFPKAYETFVGERGVKLSGGERQRVAIARAILSNARILILDEATSSLDSESERLIQGALKNLMKNKTTLVIAHRLSTIVQMDRILVLKKGRIIEDGDHATLIRQKEGLYKKLWELQSKGYL